MSKYNYYSIYDEEMPDPLVHGETLIWSGRPKKSAFVLNRTITMMPFAIIWLILDLGFITNMGEEALDKGLFLIPFFALHLMPFWIWLYNAATAGRQWKNTRYFVTDRRIIIQSGFANFDIQSIYYSDIRNLTLHIGFVDKMLGVGDIHFDLGSYIYNMPRRRNQTNQSPSHAFLDIENPNEVYPLIQKTVMDIQSDIEYPNAYRPDYNPGYNTKYTPR